MKTPLLRRELEVHRGFEGIIGESRAMEQVFALIKRVAPTEGTVLITGESGTGKEMVARALHRLSRRKDRFLLACDCTALAPTLLESELFGHVKGSFSGAIAAKQGLFEAAHEGTLFLDEVGNLSMETQGKLLRVLETKLVRKVGDTAEREVDIRLVAATNRDLTELVHEGEFREDLYYRLNVVPIVLPPLRERQGDIPCWRWRFSNASAGRWRSRSRASRPRPCARWRVITGRATSASCGTSSSGWRSFAMATASTCAHLPAEIRQAQVHAAVTQLPLDWQEFRRLKQQVSKAAVDELERRFVIDAFKRPAGNVSKAAEEVGMQRTNFHGLMRKHGLSAEGPE